MERIKSERESLLSSSLFELEMKEDQMCFCRLRKVIGVIVSCNINHLKHNFYKSRSEELFKKACMISKAEKTASNHQMMSNNENVLKGAIRKCYTFKVCYQKFSVQGDLKRHRKNAHIRIERKVGEVVENSQTKAGGDQSGEVSEHLHHDEHHADQSGGMLRILS